MRQSLHIPSVERSGPWHLDLLAVCTYIQMQTVTTSSEHDPIVLQGPVMRMHTQLSVAGQQKQIKQTLSSCHRLRCGVPLAAAFQVMRLIVVQLHRPVALIAASCRECA
jgi:hypothetical protein